MRYVNALMQSQREKRTALKQIPMVWVAAADRDTGVIEGVGFWRGEDVENILVPDLYTGLLVTRTFYPGVLELGSIRHEAGLNIRPISLRLSAISPAVAQAFRGYEARGARVQAWQRGYDPVTGQVLGQPDAWFKGFVNAAPIERPTPGGEAAIEVEIVSTARMLTITSGRKKSHAAQQLRGGDMIRKYKTTTGSWDVPVGISDERTSH